MIFQTYKEIYLEFINVRQDSDVSLSVDHRRGNMTLQYTWKMDLSFFAIFDLLVYMCTV